MKELKVRLTFIEDLLGTSPSNPEIYREFIASKSPDAATREEEVASLGVDAVTEGSKTIFSRNDWNKPILYDYQIKGFFKDACSMLSRLSKTSKEPDSEEGTEKSKKTKKTAVNESGKLTAYRKIIDGLIFVEPRQIVIACSGPLGSCQRPLRAQTAQGERIALANSETAPAGSIIEFTVKCLSDEHEAAVREWLDYGQLRGIGQWRNSGCGRFIWEGIA